MENDYSSEFNDLLAEHLNNFGIEEPLKSQIVSKFREEALVQLEKLSFDEIEALSREIAEMN